MRRKCETSSMYGPVQDAAFRRILYSDYGYPRVAYTD
jgi:hypothetical protein